MPGWAVPELEPRMARMYTNEMMAEISGGLGIIRDYSCDSWSRNHLDVLGWAVPELKPRMARMYTNEMMAATSGGLGIIRAYSCDSWSRSIWKCRVGLCQNWNHEWHECTRMK